MRKIKKFKKSLLPSKLINKVTYSRDQKLILLESSKAFIDFLKKYGFKIIKLCIHKRSKLVPKLRMLHNFGRYLLYLNKHHGSLFVVKYLKAAQLSIQRKLAGQPFSSLREIEPDLNLPRLAKCGLPAIIGTKDRKAILSGSTQVIQLYLSIFGLYRVIKAPVKTKLNTITDLFNGDISYLLNTLDKFTSLSKKFISIKKEKIPLNLDRAQILLLQTSSPSHKIACLGIGADPGLLMKAGVGPFIQRWLELTNNVPLLDMWNVLKLKTWPGSAGLWNEKEKVFTFSNYPFLSNKGKSWVKSIVAYGVGQLQFKEEAAGKLRIFAMVDIWTQSILKPLHDFLFAVLKTLPNDGTFDQNAAFERAQTKSHVSGCCFGYDLSSATDRLPILLQIAILKPIIGEELAWLWSDILVNRPYDISKSNGEDLYGIPEKWVKYAVGQPMGALSSWAMLALTHHLIMQFCNQLLGNKNWTDQYEVLGDDIVIFDRNLATKYIELMALYGVPINTSKSVVSIQKAPVVEFAKRTSYNLTDVSPISWKMFLNQDTFAGRLSIVSYWWARHNEYLFSSMKTIIQSNINDMRPEKDNNSYLSLITSLVSRNVFPIEWILAKVSEVHQIIIPFGKSKVIGFPIKWAKDMLARHWRGSDVKDLVPFISFAYSRDERYHLAAVRKQIKSILEKYTDDYCEKSFLLFVGHSGSILVRRYMYTIFFKDMLTLRMMRPVNLKHFELDQLLKILEQVQSATSTFRILEQSKKNKQQITNDLKLLKFLEDSNKKSNRADPNICPMTFFTWGQMMFTGFQQRH